MKAEARPQPASKARALPGERRILSTRLNQCACAVLVLTGLLGSVRSMAQVPELALTLTRQLSTMTAQAPQPGPGSAAASAEDTLARPARCGNLPASRLTALSLADALDYVVCRSPQLGQALLLVEERRAGVAEADSAYRPRFFASAEYAANRIPSSNSDLGSLGSSLTGSLGLTWTLMDFGVRDANARQTRFSLDSASAAQQAAALNAVNQGMQMFVEAAAAQTRLEAARETEEVSRKSLDVVQGKYDAQVAGLTEKLQTETALAQARLERVRAEGAWDTARGLLAVAMGLPPEQPIALAPPQNAFPSSDNPAPGRDWIEDAKTRHPRIRSAAADVQALQARLSSLQAGGKGSVGLSLGWATTRDLNTPGSRFEHNVTGSVVASVPLFNGAEQNAREAQVVAQISARESALTQAQRDVENELWRNVKLVQSEKASLEATSDLLYAASKSYEISVGRYRSGVGSIQELLTTQNALANARAQMTQARLSRAWAELKLAVASGRLMISR